MVERVRLERDGEPVSFAAFFAHVDQCRECNDARADLCSEGERLRKDASARMSGMIRDVVPVVAGVGDPEKQS